jgi:DNA-binding PadR family transcriptional regulator
VRLLSPKAALILSAFLNRPDEAFYGYELLQATGMKSGSLYPILGRFEKLGWISGTMVPSPNGRPARCEYRLIPESKQEAWAALDRYLEVKQVPIASRIGGWGIA